MKNYVIAHDLGTTGNKATLYDREGRLVGSAFYAYDTIFAHTGWAEQNPEDWWQAVCNSTQRLLQDTHVRGDEIACISFSGQMMGCVPLDAHAHPIRDAIIWADQRAVQQEAWIAERIDPDTVYKITGHRLSASYSLCKILWLRDHQPEIYRNTHKFVHAKDAIIARLTGQFVTEPSDASGMNLFDLEQNNWAEAILNAVDLDTDKLPQLYRSIDVVGEVSSTVAEEVGIAAGTPVVAGGGDGACATAGAGAIKDGIAYNYVGSSSWIGAASNRPIYDPDTKTFTFGHIIPHMFMPAGTMQAAGASYQWTRDQICLIENQAASSIDISPYEVMNMKAETSSPGANGLIFLPYLMGERSPRWNPKARGAFVGLTIRHTRADMIRAVLEGITLNLRVILDAFLTQGLAIDSMRVIGGGARGRFWNQIMADIYGMPVHRLAILEEATSMGAALAGGVGVGLYEDFSIIEDMNKIVATIDPNPANHRRYQEIYAVFNETYEALVPVYEKIASLSSLEPIDESS
ncbi:MAG: xylulokinase [Chloroflexi bacterium]|nr:MAG: xylulokinase [Phototrophicales bacterium]RMF80777.1 MAG: xylulokinase [Chloroflexota bacterium]